jgi:hypothetical protein
MLSRFGLINVAYADIGELVKRVNAVILNPFIVFLFAVALVYFIYGVFEFLANAESEDARTKGKQHMLWGVIGMFIMMAVFGIMQVIINTIGIPGVSPRG